MPIPHMNWHEHRPLAIIRSIDTTPRHVLAFQTMRIGVQFPHWPTIDRRSAKVAFDGGRHEEGEGDIGVFDGERLIEH